MNPPIRITSSPSKAEPGRVCARAIVVAAVLLLALAGGCAPKTQGTRAQIYTGPTLPLAEVVTAINANNQRLPTLWARVTDFEAWVYDEQKHQTYVNGIGTLIYRKPQDLRLRIQKPLAGTIMLLGSNDERYWLSAPEGVERMWWGHHRNSGKPCVKEMPIRPDLVLEVLGITEIGSDLLEPPAPTMRFNNDADAYMLTWVAPAVDRSPPRWIVQREVWYDRKTLQPVMVLLFDANGRVVLRARLTKHQPVQMPDVPREQWPVVATHYELYFPDSGSRIVMDLGDMALTFKGTPNDLSFRFPENPEVPQDRVIQIDADCGP